MEGNWVIRFVQVPLGWLGGEERWLKGIGSFSFNFTESVSVNAVLSWNKATSSFQKLPTDLI